jgi:hypothetical protein
MGRIEACAEHRQAGLNAAHWSRGLITAAMPGRQLERGSGGAKVEPPEKNVIQRNPHKMGTTAFFLLLSRAALPSARPRLALAIGLPWLEREFGWDERTAQRYISAHELALKYDTVSDLDLPLRGLYLLAAPSTPDEARQAVIEAAADRMIGCPNRLL